MDVANADTRGADGGMIHGADDVSKTQQKSARGGLDLLPEVGGYVDDNVNYNWDNVEYP